MKILESYFRHRSTALLMLVLPILVWTLTPGSPSAAQLLVGAGLVAAGGALRLCAIRCLGRGARVHQAGVRGDLVVAGPYAFTRNPLYLAAGLVLCGLAFVAGGGVWSLLLLPATILVYTPVVLHEERVLRGEAARSFAAYERVVPRWLGIRRGAAPTSVDRTPWREVLRREKLLVPGLVLAVAAIASVRADFLPLREQLELLSFGALPVAALTATGLLIGAVGNSFGIDRKRRRRAGRSVHHGEGEGVLPAR